MAAVRSGVCGVSRPAFLHAFARPGADAQAFVKIVRGEGAVVWDELDNRYVDALASLWYCNIGHGRGEMVDAVAEQMRSIAAFHTFDRFTNKPAERLTERLSAMAPMPDARVFLATGDHGGSYEGRLYGLLPTERWSSDYITPVGSRNAAEQQTRAQQRLTHASSHRGFSCRARTARGTRGRSGGAGMRAVPSGGDVQPMWRVPADLSRTAEGRESGARLTGSGAGLI